MERKLKHLEFIQSIITRMGTNSFLIKGWSITIASAIFVLSTKNGNPSLIPVAYLPVIVFWFLDTYFLRQERLYRKLYDSVRVKVPDDIDFSLDATGFSSYVDGYLKTLFSITLRWFHGILLLAVIAANVITGIK